jgi:hypothetical protein
VCVIVTSKVYSRVVLMCSINGITSLNPVYSHTITHYNIACFMGKVYSCNHTNIRAAQLYRIVLKGLQNVTVRLVHARLGSSMDPQISLKRIVKSKGPKAVPCEHKTSQCKKMKGCGSYERAEAHLHQGVVKPTDRNSAKAVMKSNKPNQFVLECTYRL